MVIRNEIAMVEAATKRLAELLGAFPKIVRGNNSRTSRGKVADLVCKVGGKKFVLVIGSSASSSSIASAVAQARRHATTLDAIPLVVTPYMGDVGRVACEASGVSWLDLSGNAKIDAPGLRVHVEGKPNLFKQRGRPANPFAPKISRIVRWFLTHPLNQLPVSQRALAKAVDLDEGYTSRAVKKLEEDGFVSRGNDGVRLAMKPDDLLDAWRERYDFGKNHILKGHIPARSGEELLREMGTLFRRRGIEHAATGLAGAWLLSHFANFRITTMYVRGASRDLLEALSFREEAKGANVWIVEPRDEGVFHGSSERDGIACVHPIQVYLDLKGHPERSAEAADRLRKDFFGETYGN